MNFCEYELFILQPTTFCNLDCIYCWLPDRDLKKRMSHETFRAFLNRIGDSAENLSKRAEMVWHGGEPLALGVEYYRQCLEDLKRISEDRGFRLPVGIQTNATLIDEKWIDLFLEYNIQIGISVDGPEWLHDSHRPYRNKMGSHAKTSRGITLLSDAGIQFSVISVLTANSLKYPDEIYDYFLTLPTTKGFAFNVDEDDGANKHSSILSCRSPEMEAAVRFFFKRLLELNESNGRPLDIRDFSKFRMILDGEKILGSDSFSSMVRAGALMNVDYQGNVSTFCPELLMGFNNQEIKDRFIFGNVNVGGFDEIRFNPNFLDVSAEIELGRELCKRNCEYFFVCGGGSPSNRFSEFSRFDVAETSWCRYQTKAVADGVMDYIEERSRSILP